ncbi:MAG: alpha/beta hydrolase [Pseudomonadota bacterium]
MKTVFGPDVQIVLVPGLHDSGPDHWQSRWHRTMPGSLRVEQDDWDRPDLDAWSARLERVLVRDGRRNILVAHSFGCLVAVHRIAQGGAGYIGGALLVAPADPGKFGLTSSVPATELACPTLMVSSRNDPWMAEACAAGWARRWGSILLDAGALGHINAESGLGGWQFGLDALQRLIDMAHGDVLSK